MNHNSSKGKRELRRISFEPAKGGVISRSEFRTKRGGQGGGPDYDHEEEMGVHPSMKHAQDHLASMMGHMFPQGEASEEKAEKE